VNDVTITPTDNGPYLVQGNVTLLDAEGNRFEAGDTIASRLQLPRPRDDLRGRQQVEVIATLFTDRRRLLVRRLPRR
jgi:hypothetical protein